MPKEIGLCEYINDICHIGCMHIQKSSCYIGTCKKGMKTGQREEKLTLCETKNSNHNLKLLSLF